MTMLYTAIAQRLLALRNCEASDNATWATNHRNGIHAMVREHMPSGSGFDAGTSIDLQASTPEKLVFVTAFHHMNDVGMYDGWTRGIRVTVRPSLCFAIELAISGRNRNGIKDDIDAAFRDALLRDVKA